ncbi:MAG: hypothetical protein ACYTDT_04545 [Planctomycetota bacterium]|jgi:hypothetical protein
MSDSSNLIQAEELAELLNAVLDPGVEDFAKPAQLDSLNVGFWAKAAEIVTSLVTEDLSDLEISLPHKMFLNFGIFEHAKLDSLHTMFQPWLDMANENSRISFLHDGLVETYTSAMRVDELSRLQGQLDNIKQELEDWPDFHIERIKFRDHKILELNTQENAEVLLKYYSEMDEILESYFRLEFLQRHDGLNSDDDRALWNSLQKFISECRAAIASILSSSAKSEITPAASAVEESVQHLIGLHQERRATESRLRDEEGAVHDVTCSGIITALNSELAQLETLLRLASRYGKSDASAVPYENEPNWVRPEEALQCLIEVEAFDPGVFHNSHARRYGAPALCFVPGVGSGVYDSSRNRLIVPQRCRESVLKSVAHAVALYRLDIDAGSNNQLISSFGRDTPESYDNSSKLKQRMHFVDAYLDWVLHEAQGNELFPRETRNWFEDNIAPAKAAPWIPVDGYGLNARQIRSKIAEEVRKPVAPEQQYRLAVFQWKLDPFNKEHNTNVCIPLIDKALALAPSNLKYVYSGAVLHMKTGSFQRAIDLFSQFARDAKQSWWSLKAIELCAKCR